MYQVSNNRNNATGRLCVDDMKFVSVNKLLGNFEANGIVGLAPNSHERSYINKLFAQN